MGRFAVSVVVPCRNAASTVGAQLEALTRQRWSGDWEVVLVDDGSTDDTLQVVEAFRGRLPLVLVPSGSSRPSPAAARNRGVRVARGEFILFCDADDVVDDGWAEAMQTALRDHDFVCCYETEQGLNDPSAIATYGRFHKGLAYWQGDRPFLPFAGSGALGVRRSLHDAIGGFDEWFERGGEDEDYCWRIQKQTGTDLHFVRDAVIHYRYRTQLRAIFRQARNGGASRVYLWVKWRDDLPAAGNQWAAGFWAWVRVLSQVRFVHDRGSLGHWIRWIATLLGHAEASAHLHVRLPCSYPQLAHPPSLRRRLRRLGRRSPPHSAQA